MILILEDDRSISAAIRYYLEVAGCQAIETSSPAEALQVLLTEPIDCLISDYFIEGGTIQTVVRELRRRCLNIPVIMVSGVPQQHDPTLPVYTWLAKPVDLSVLERTMRRACAEVHRLLDLPAS